MRDGNVPRFFVRRRRSGQSPADGTARGPSLRAQLIQLIPAFLKGKSGERKEERRQDGREGRGGGRKKVEGMEEDGKLLVEQIKTKNGAFPRRVVLYYYPTICFAFSTTWRKSLIFTKQSEKSELPKT